MLQVLYLLPLKLVCLLSNPINLKSHSITNRTIQMMHIFLNNKEDVQKQWRGLLKNSIPMAMVGGFFECGLNRHFLIHHSEQV